MLSLWAIQVWSVFKCRSIAKFEHTEISNVHVSKSFLIILFSWAKEEVPGDVHLQAGAGDGEGLILPQSLVLIACEVRASNLLSQVSINLTLRDFIYFFFFTLSQFTQREVQFLWSWRSTSLCPLSLIWDWCYWKLLEGKRIETIGFVPFVCHKCPLLHPICWCPWLQPS